MAPMGGMGSNHPGLPTPSSMSVDQPKTDPKVLARELGSRLKIARQSAGVSAADAAKQLNRTAESIRAYERGKGNVPDWALQALAELYGVPELWLRTGKGIGPVTARRPAYPHPPPEIDTADAAGYKAYPALPLRPVNAPRRYRLVCPSCGKPWQPEDLGRHLMIGDSCSRKHDFEEAERLLTEAHRDPLPWLEALEKGRQRIEHFQTLMDSAPDEVRRDVYRISLQLYRHWMHQIETLGPDKYEWADG